MYICFYGTLKNTKSLPVDRHLRYVGEVVVPGLSIYKTPKLTYPLGRVDQTTPPSSEGTVCSCYEVLDEVAIKWFDWVESYDDADVDNSLFVRRIVNTSCGREVFLYEWNWEYPQIRVEDSSLIRIDTW